MWTQIQNTGKGGYGERLTDKLDDYIAQAGKLEELTDQLYEGLTGISFDGMYSSFIDNLMNMKYGAKDAAEDISEYFMRAMLSNKIGEMYSEKLKAWWEKFGKAMEDNELTEAERNALTEEYMQYVDEALALRDNLAAATGYDKAPKPQCQPPECESGRIYGHDAGPGHEAGGHVHQRAAALEQHRQTAGKRGGEDGHGRRASGPDSREHRCERRTPGRTEGSDKENDT